MTVKLTYLKNNEVYVTLHKASLKCQFFNISGQDTIFSKIWNLRVQKNLNIEKIAFQIVQMQFLAMHITNQKSFYIFTVIHLQNILMEHDLYLISSWFLA